MSGLRPRQRVRHAKFGEGVVLEVEGAGYHARARIDFPRGGGSKWLVVGLHSAGNRVSRPNFFVPRYTTPPPSATPTPVPHPGHVFPNTGLTLKEVLDDLVADGLVDPVRRPN
ncbi:MAG: hypothetical protein U5O69_10500 [Candidatus Competibacteraceae bacterium]|nr:hypothetical protein [Candidatus Competibacteraceae bacterium]